MRTTTVVIGAGHSGLAMSRCLSERSIDHVVLERSEVANSWRTERWDSLRLLTPNWQCRLPGYAYDGDDPDGFMTMPEVVDFITDYAKLIAAPVACGTTVTSVRRTDDGYQVTTDQGEWRCATVVLATGAFNLPHVPAFAEAVPSSVTTLTPMEYRNPDQLADGGVIVVGASATGVQIAAEIQRSGRAGHAGRGRARAWTAYVPGPGHPLVDGGGRRARRALRRGRRHRAGTAGAVDAARRLRRTGDLRPQRAHEHRREAGRPVRRHQRGPGAVLRVAAQQVRAGRPQARPAARHHRRMGHGQRSGRLGAAAAPVRSRPLVDASPPLGLDLTSGEIETIIWATGFRPDYSWLDVTVLDGKGMIRHDGGVVDSPGMYLIGSPFLRRRKSSFIDGARADAEELIVELTAYLDGQATAGFLSEA